MNGKLKKQSSDRGEPTRKAASRCSNCGHQLDGPYCSQCGQRASERNDHSLRRYLNESFAVLTSADSRAVRSVKALLRRPGLLTAEYFQGRRAAYLAPLQLFLLCNIFYFFVQPMLGFNTLSTPLRIHLTQLPYSGLARKLVDAEVAGRPGGMTEYTLLFDATINSQAKTFVIVMVPLLALVLFAMFWRVRRYYVPHLVFATHFYAYFLLALPLLLALVGLIGMPLARAGLRLGINEGFLQWFFDQGTFLVLFVPYFYLAVRRVYEVTRPKAAVSALLLVLAMLGVLQIYRFILFFTTLYSI